MTRIVSLNIRHGGGKRQSALACWLTDANADVLVLSEWRSETAILAAALSEAGYVSHVAVRPQRNVNGVAIFSRSPRQAIRVTPEDSPKGELLLVREERLAIVGTYFPQQMAKGGFFQRCSVLAAETTQPLLILGDMNTGSNSLDLEPGASAFFCEREFNELSTTHGLSDLWRLQHGMDAREWTWRSSRNGFRIDHAFANETFIAAFPSWRCVYEHAPREQGITDHSAIVIDL